MGCGESKIKNISLTSKSDWSSEEVGDTTEIENDKTKQIWTAAQAAIKFKPKFEKDGWEGLDSRGELPNSLLDTIPSSDLGESLDTRGHHAHLGKEPEVEQNSGGTRSAPVSANSLDSGDSGYDEYDEDYSHIITEYSSKDIVEAIIQEFRPVDLPELLVITGRACTRILSGYEKNKQEEERILSDLRTEGLLAKPGGKSKSGMSFEIVDMNSDLNESFVSTSSLLPSVKLSRLEQRRETVKKTDVDIETQMAEAEVRRRNMEAERIKKLSELSGLNKIEKSRAEQIKQQEVKQEVAMQQRKEQLESMRSKLKQKSKKADMVRLKKALALDSSMTEADFSNSFFDD